MFAHAIAQAKTWREQIDPNFQISVNLSPVQLQSKARCLQWQHHLQTAQLGGEAVVLEITEGLLLEMSAHISAELLAYRDAGIQVAIDDFGTGYSALAYLKQMDIDFLKIDQSFVRNLDTDASNHALCEAIVVMAHKLGLKVIAEGVETIAQRDLLQAMGCDYAQGYSFAKALPAESIELRLASRVGRVSPNGTYFRHWAFGNEHVRFALIENEACVRQTVRGIKAMFKADGVMGG